MGDRLELSQTFKYHENCGRHSQKLLGDTMDSPKLPSESITNILDNTKICDIKKALKKLQVPASLYDEYKYKLQDWIPDDTLENLLKILKVFFNV